MQDIITDAVSGMEQGGIIAFPTDTVYSLSANATDSKAIDRIYQLKGRDYNNPLAILVPGLDFAARFVKLNETAYRLAERFCPGALTMVLPLVENCGICREVNNGSGTLAIRIPACNTALAILNKADFPVAGTSANPSGQPPAVLAEEVKGYFQDWVDMVLDGKVGSGTASTVVDVTGEAPLILREGGITSKDIIDFIATTKN